MQTIHYREGDIFDSSAQVIVNTVNCRGVMGKGLALSFKQRYPDMFVVYQQECKTGKLRIGRPTLYKGSTPWILNFPTKDHWRYPSKMEYIEKGLAYFVAHYKEAGITSIAFPKLGAQNGKLSWDEVGPVMAKYLGQLDIDIYIYITEGDEEYQQYEPQANEARVDMWGLFNEIALSAERLHEEVHLSSTDAGMIARKRKSMQFTSLDDFNNMKKLTGLTRQRIASYINCQQPATIELSGTSPLDDERIEIRGRERKKVIAPPRQSQQGKKRGRKETSTEFYSLWT